MADFDPVDIVGAAQTAARGDFEPEDIVSQTTAARPGDFAAEDLAAPPPAEQPPLRPSGVAGTLSPEDIQKIAAKHGVDPTELGSRVSYFATGSVPEESVLEMGGKQLAGLAGRVAFNLPQKLYLETREPKMRAALEEVQSIGETQRGPVQMLAEGAALPVGSIARTASTAAKIAHGAATGAAVGAATGLGISKHGEELESTATGAGWGAILGGGGGAIAGLAGREGAAATQRSATSSVRKAEKALPDFDVAIQKVASETQASEKAAADSLAHALETGEAPRLTDEQVSIISKEQFPHNPEPSREAAEAFVEKRLRNYAEDLTGSRPKGLEDAIERIRGETNRGEQYLRQRYQEMAQREMAERTGTQINQQRGFWGQAADFGSDSQYVLRDIDNRTGSKLEPALNQLNKDYNRSTYKLADWRRRLDQVFRANRKANVDGNILYRELTSGQVPPEHAQAAQRVQDFFADFHKFQTGTSEVAPLGTRKLENYVPNYAKDTAEIIPIVEKRRDLALQEASQIAGKPVADFSELTPEQFQSLTSGGAGKDLLEFANWGRDIKVQDGRGLEQTIEHALTSDRGKQDLEVIARSSLERTGDIPDFLKEKNVYKLMSMYTANTVRAMYLRNGVDKLRYQMQILQNAGADKDAAYVRRLIQDIQGIRSGTAAAANRTAKTTFYRNIDKMIESAGGQDTVVGGALTGVKALPDFLRELSHQIYPASLGLNIRAALQNGTASITKLAPELGGKYGYTTTLKAVAKSLTNFREQYARARASGLVPEGFIRAGEAAIAEGFQASSLYQVPKQVLEGISKYLMSLHQATETINRVITSNAGEIMGRELAAGKAGARAALNRFPRTVRRAVDAAGGDAELIGSILSKHLNDTTQYNYNRMSMNEFGRTFGPMFSVFTKWPAATAGDIIATYREKGALRGSLRNAEKYLAPALVLHAASMAVGQHSFTGAKEELSDRQKQLMGGSGLVQAAPISNVLGIARGEVGLPPAASIAYHGVLQPLAEGKGLTGDAAQRVAGQFVQSFAPGVGIVRFLTQDLVTFLTGHKPEGDFFEKTAEGASRLNKELE